jgi:hypothetical protein
MAFAVGDRFVELAKQKTIDAIDQLHRDVALHRERLGARQRLPLLLVGQ